MPTLDLYVDTAADIARIINLTLSATILVWSAARIRRWFDADRAGQMFRAAIVAFAVSIAVGSWETLTYPVPAPGVRTYLITLGLCLSLTALWWDTRDHHHHAR